MIKILRDVVGRNGNIVPIPFTLENLPEKALSVEVLIKSTSNPKYFVRVDCIYKVTDEGETNITEITKDDEDGLFVAKIKLSEVADAESVYIRVYNNDTSFITPQIHITKDSDATLQTHAIELDFRPKSIKVIDSVDCTANGALVAFDASNFKIQVLASNNSTSKTPAWEDMTSEYLNKSEFVFVNNEKDNDKLWSVSVKYVVKKLSTNSTVEISDIKLIVL